VKKSKKLSINSKIKKQQALFLDSSEDIVQTMIYLVRGQKIMLDCDLAFLYGVEAKVLNQAVKRNIERFPEDFAFQLSKEEYNSLISQFAISKVSSLRSQIVTLKKTSRGSHRKYLPYVFTEQGVAMLSGVLNSSRAIQVNIAIMRAFTKLRRIISSHKELCKKIEEMENKYDKQFKVVFIALKELLKEPKKKEGKKLPLGFHPVKRK